jgi:hypothetical protein
MPEPRTTAPITLSLPLAVEQELRALASMRGLPVSIVAAELLEAGREAPRRGMELEARIATLEADLATRPPPDFQDLILDLTPGTSRLMQQRDAARAECEELEAKLAKAEEQWGAWEDSSDAWEADCTAAREERDAMRADRDQLRQQLAARKRELEAARTAVAAEQARRIPVWCRFPLPLPIPYPAFIRLPVPTPWRPEDKLFDPLGWVLWTLRVLMFGTLLLAITPYDLKGRRSLATAAMGTWGDTPGAAARLLGGAIRDQGDLLQLYALARARDNPERLARCFETAEHDRQQGKREAVPCTILVPVELRLRLDVATSDPHAGTSRANASMEARQRWDAPPEVKL